MLATPCSCAMPSLYLLVQQFCCGVGGTVAEFQAYLLKTPIKVLRHVEEAYRDCGIGIALHGNAEHLVAEVHGRLSFLCKLSL